MNNEKLTTEYDTEDVMDVTAEQLAAVDSLLRSIGAEEDSKVDYNGMLRGIKAKAMEQGLAAELNRGRGKTAAERRKKLRRIFSIAGSAAAALVVGVGILSVISHGSKSIQPGGDTVGHDALNDATSAPMAVVTSAPTQKGGNPEPTLDPAPLATSEPALPTDNTETVESTPLPTEYAIRGGVRGYTYLGCFETPEELSALVPEVVNETMVVEPFEDRFGYTAKSRTDGEWRYIECRLEDADEASEPEGAAVYTVKDNGNVSFIWRINGDKVMYIDFEGFEYSVAEEILLTFIIKPVPTER